MACVEAILVPDSIKKVDELFLFWLSEPSTQEMLRKEISKVCGMRDHEETADPVQPTTTSAVTSVLRPGSPGASPPHILNRSPKSPRSKPKAKSSRRGQKLANVFSKLNIGRSEEVDLPGIPEVVEGTELPHQGAAAATAASPSISEPLTPSDSKQPPHHAAALWMKTVPPAYTSEVIPKFYFPHGKPRPDEDLEQCLRDVAKVFQGYPKGEIPQNEFHTVVKAMNLPLYWKAPLFKACAGKSRKTVSYVAFKRAWQRITHSCHDDAARFVRMMAGGGRNYLVEQDFEVLVQDIVDTHPGLGFLTSAPEFHARYTETVIGRIFYVVDRTWNGRITAAELRKSNFLQMLALLEEESDINQVTDYFSYEHFYVIYCKFWELDTDHDLIIDAQDLSRHADHTLTPRIIQRILSGVVTRDKSVPPGKMSYKDFIWFLLSEEDKSTQRSTEYWFRCMDLDGDGVLSLYEMEYFYEEVLQKLQELNIDCLSVENTVCQILDMVNPREKDKISLRDLKACKMTSVFFNTFMNVDKYLEYEQRDPVAAIKDESENANMSNWDRYAAEQYEVLLAEEAYEQGNESGDGGSDLGEEEEMATMFK